jgi:hypothetical protein
MTVTHAPLSPPRPAVAPLAVPARTRGVVAQGFKWVEDVVYISLGVLLAVSAIVLLGSTAPHHRPRRGRAAGPDPDGRVQGARGVGRGAFRLAVIDLAVLTVMILTLVVSLAMLKGRHAGGAMTAA